MIEIILIVSLSGIFIILLRRLPEVDSDSSSEMPTISEIGTEKIDESITPMVYDKPTIVMPKPISEDKLSKLWQKAEFEFNRQNYSRAEKFYIKIVSLDPRNPKVYGRLGIIYLEQKNYLDANNAFSEATKRESKNALWHNNLGLALYNLKRFDESIEAYKKSVALDRNKAIRFFNLGLAYESIGNFKNALESYEKAAKLEPANNEFQSLIIKIKEEIAKK